MIPKYFSALCIQTGLKNNTDRVAVREAGVSLGIMEAPLKPLGPSQHYRIKHIQSPGQRMQVLAVWPRCKACIRLPLTERAGIYVQFEKSGGWG